MDLDYDSCAQFLARLDADAENANVITDSSSPIGGLDSALSLSPYENRCSASPPGLSSGSATSRSPESLRFEYDGNLGWNPNDPAAFFDSAALLPSGQWDDLMQPDQQQNQQNQQVVSPLSDYIKIEGDNSPGYFIGPQQATISPTNSLLDPTTQTALEGGFSFPKDDSIFDFNNFGRQNQGSSSESFSPLAWRNQTQQRDDFSPLNWQSPSQQGPPQQNQRQHQHPNRQSMSHQSQHHSREPSSLRNSLSPSSSHSHHTTSSPESRAHDSHSDDNNVVPRPKKRKATEDNCNGKSSMTSSSGGRKQQPKKTAHNMIEKRYRTNLNDKIAALRDSVPSLRVMAGTSKLGDDDDDEDLEGLTPAHKLNKATVLAKATEYIRHLEKRTKRLQDENDQLKNRLSAFEKLATMGSMTGQGQQGNGRGGGPGGGLMSRLMVGSLAGLMVANGLQEQEGGSRQLIAFPVTALEILGIPLPFHIFTGNQTFCLLFKITLLFAAIVYISIPGFFDAKSKNEKPGSNNSQNPHLSAAPSLASPLVVRQKAWLTAIQTVWVPRHSFALEVAALGIKTVKLGLRKIIGWERYAMITGMTEEHEISRVKAWTIALDAQLAGGDATITNSRLILTLLASLTLPATPSRLMLNALHIKVLFWDFGSSFDIFADKLADYYWKEARIVQLKVDSDSSESLPKHLAKLLEINSSIALDYKIIRKAYNLAYNRETQAGCDGQDEGMDTVVEDISIRSPLDALAAWYSSLVLQNVCIASLKAKSTPTFQKMIQEGLRTALAVAPPSSGAQLRAQAAKAVLDGDDDGHDLLVALKTFDEDLKSHNQSQDETFSGHRGVPRNMITPMNTAVTVTSDIRVTIRCAMTLVLLKKGSREAAMRLFSDLDWQQAAGEYKNSLGLLGFVASWKTLNYFVALEDKWAKEAGDAVDKAAAMLRIWIGDKKIPKKAGVHNADCKKVIDFCNSLQKKLAGFSDDADDGYVSADAEVEKRKSEKDSSPMFTH